jgi:hypothetical protein
MRLKFDPAAVDGTPEGVKGRRRLGGFGSVGALVGLVTEVPPVRQWRSEGSRRTLQGLPGSLFYRESGKQGLLAFPSSALLWRQLLWPHTCSTPPKSQQVVGKEIPCSDVDFGRQGLALMHGKPFLQPSRVEFASWGSPTAPYLAITIWRRGWYGSMCSGVQTADEQHNTYVRGKRSRRRSDRGKVRNCKASDSGLIHQSTVEYSVLPGISTTAENNNKRY